MTPLLFYLKLLTACEKMEMSLVGIYSPSLEFGNFTEITLLKKTSI